MITFEDIEQNSEGFRTYMEEIDARLRKAGVPIHARPLRAFQEISKDGMSMVIGGVLPHPHANRINDWFQTRYGDRLLVDFSIGKAVILVRGDPYVIKLPLILGQWDGVVDVNKTFVGMTKDLFADLPESDRSDMVAAFVWFYQRFKKMENLSDSALANIDTAILQMTSQSPHYGESQWASLQAAEKTLKEFIKHRKAKPPRTHDLDTLLAQAEQLSLQQGLWPLLSMIQCSAGVRYDNGVSLEQAVAAHHASIDLCAAVADQLSANGTSPNYPSAAVSELAISFVHAVDMNHNGGLLFRFRMADGSEQLLLVSAAACFLLVDCLRKSLAGGRHKDTRQEFMHTRDFRNSPPRHPVRMFLANEPTIGLDDFERPVKQITGFKVDDFTNGIRFDFQVAGNAPVKITMCSTLVNYFLDYLDGGIMAGQEKGLFCR